MCHNPPMTDRFEKAKKIVDLKSQITELEKQAATVSEYARAADAYRRRIEELGKEASRINNEMGVEQARKLSRGDPEKEEWRPMDCPNRLDGKVKAFLFPDNPFPVFRRASQYGRVGERKLQWHCVGPDDPMDRRKLEEALAWREATGEEITKQTGEEAFDYIRRVSSGISHL